jgi:hypothetical protein
MILRLYDLEGARGILRLNDLVEGARGILRPYDLEGARGMPTHKRLGRLG